MIDIGSDPFHIAIGDELELVAPGQQIVSTGAFGGVCVVGGTSLAAPHVTAVASVLWQKDKSVSADFIRSLLAFTANQYGEDYEYGNGLVDLDFALGQYDAFKEVYAADADVLNEQVEEAITDGSLEVNEKPVVEFEDVVYVEGRWLMDIHEGFAELTSSESGNQLSANGIKVVKWGARMPDVYFTYMTYYPELHGFTSKKPNKKFEYYSNYVYSYIYLTEIASNVYNSTTKINPAAVSPKVTATCTDLCIDENGNKKHAEGWCITQVKDHIKSCFNESGLNDDEAVTRGRGLTWSEVFKNKEIDDNEKNGGLFIYGMALHTITDLFAHSTYRVSTGKYITHPDADTIIEGETRYDCAALAAQHVISHIKRHESGNVLDFYHALEKESKDPTFRLLYLTQYIKAVSPNDYQNHQSVFDTMTQKKETE